MSSWQAWMWSSLRMQRYTLLQHLQLRVPGRSSGEGHHIQCRADEELACDQGGARCEQERGGTGDDCQGGAEACAADPAEEAPLNIQDEGCLGQRWQGQQCDDR